LQYSSSADQTLSGVISGAGSLTKDTSTSSTLTLSGANTYDGGTTVVAGILQAGSNTAFGDSSGVVEVYSPDGVLDLNGFAIQNKIFYYGVKPFSEPNDPSQQNQFTLNETSVNATSVNATSVNATSLSNNQTLVNAADSAQMNRGKFSPPANDDMVKRVSHLHYLRLHMSMACDGEEMCSFGPQNGLLKVGEDPINLEFE
jgi:autotransporter-associated beta strand protein